MPKDPPTADGYFERLAAERPDIALCRAAAAVVRSAETAAREQGLGVGAHLVLQMLDAVGPCSQQVLGSELRIDRSAMVRVCDELEGLGAVERVRNPNDRRSYAVTLTDDGRRRLAVAEAAVPAFLDAIFGALRPDDRRRLVDLLLPLLDEDSNAAAGTARDGASAQPVA
ncbi:MarR family winged helix-turn-helix transcriptional regulator [Agromyces sp. MMS24-K17]|uniref:MarR family winged helix-turn-helix transcriptional regulator n=1 Tax=Agromyces sp. MMS24-K17 TaxID=3372850 RepID=UPI0037544881